MKSKKTKIFILIAVIVLIPAIIFVGLKLFKSPKDVKTNIFTGEIVKVLKNGYEIEVDNLDGEDDFVKVIVNYDSSKFAKNDYVKVTGKQLKRKAIEVNAENIVKTSYIEEYSPTIKSKEQGQIHAQFGYIVTFENVELSKTETRIYITVANMGESKIDLLLEDAILVSYEDEEEKEFKYQPNLKAKYPSNFKQIPSGEESKGIITFPNLEEGIMTLKLQIASSEDTDKIEDYIFNFGI